MSISIEARLVALEKRAEAVEIVTAEVLLHLLAATQIDTASFQAGLMDLAKKYQREDEECDAGRRAAGVHLARILDAWAGKPIKTDAQILQNR